MTTELIAFGAAALALGCIGGYSLARRIFRVPSCPSWEDHETRELIEAALSWQKRRTDPGGQDRRLDTALRNWRGRWNR